MTNNSILQIIEDFSMPGMVYLLYKVADRPAGRVKSFRMPGMPQGFGALSPGDLPDPGQWEILNQFYPLTGFREAGFYGQPVLPVYGPDQHKLADLINKIELDYESNPDIKVSKTPIFERSWRNGNIEDVLDDFFHEVKRSYSISIPAHNYNSTMCSCAYIDDKTLNVYTSCSWPFWVYKNLNQFLAKEKLNIHVYAPQVEGFFDNPVWFPALIALYTGLCAVRTKKPVKSIFTLDALDEIYSKPYLANVEVESYLNKYNEVLFNKIGIDVEVGAYPLLPKELSKRISLSALGPFPEAKYEVRTRLLCNAKPPLDCFTGWGTAEGFFISQAHREFISSQSKVKTTQDSNTKKSTVPGYLQEVKDRVIELSDFNRKRSAYSLRKPKFDTSQLPLIPLKGIGIAQGIHGNGMVCSEDSFERYSVRARLDQEGKLTLSIPALPLDQALIRFWTGIATGILHLNYREVFFDSAPCKKNGGTGPSLFSRNISIIPRLIEQCCHSIQKQRFRSPLPLEVSRNYRTRKRVKESENKFTFENFDSVSYANTVVELQIEPLGYYPQIRGIWIVLTCGHKIPQALVRQKLEAAVHRSLYNSIGLSTNWFSAFQADPFIQTKRLEVLPPLHIELLPVRTIKYEGFNSIAEATIPAAYCSALNQAIGLFFDKKPVTPGDLMLTFGVKA